MLQYQIEMALINHNISPIMIIVSLVFFIVWFDFIGLNPTYYKQYSNDLAFF